MNNFATLYIVRHGQSESNINKEKGFELESKPGGSNLTEVGVTQAQILPEKLKDIHFDKAFSSDLIRAHRTAEIITKEKNLEVETTEILRERSRGKIVGPLEDQLAKNLGNIFEELELMTPEEQKELQATYGVELREEATSRILTFLREIAVAYPNKTVLVTCHGALMRSLLMHLGYGRPHELNSGSVTNTAYVILESDGVDFFIKETNGVYKKGEK